MKRANIYFDHRHAGVLEEIEKKKAYRFQYDTDYSGPPISLTLPVRSTAYEFDSFPAFFDGLLPEGPQLEALLKQAKLDRHDYFEQLIVVGRDLVGAVTVENAS